MARLTPKTPQKGNIIKKAAKKLFTKSPDKVVNVITSSIKKVTQAVTQAEPVPSSIPSSPPPNANIDRTGDLQCSSSSEEMNEEIVSFSPPEDTTQTYQPTAPAQSTSVSTISYFKYAHNLDIKYMHTVCSIRM